MPDNDRSWPASDPSDLPPPGWPLDGGEQQVEWHDGRLVSLAEADRLAAEEDRQRIEKYDQLAKLDALSKQVGELKAELAVGEAKTDEDEMSGGLDNIRLDEE